VRGLIRRAPGAVPTTLDPAIEWIVGDLREAGVRQRAVDGMRGVIHAAGWVSLGSDPRGESRAVNVDATAGLLQASRRAGVERFVYTSTIWTVAAGSATEPATEESEWNLASIRSPYCESKRAAERLVLDDNGPEFRTAVLCPGMVLGPGGDRPTSTRLLLELARLPVAILARGGIPVVDVRVVAHAHIRGLERAEPGSRHVVAGPYVSYPEIAELVARVARWPRRIVIVPDVCERPLTWLLKSLDGWSRGRFFGLTAATIAGGFLRLHVSGAKADRDFGLCHPSPLQLIFDTLDDCRRNGQARWLPPLRPIDGDNGDMAPPSRSCPEDGMRRGGLPPQVELDSPEEGLGGFQGF
jgi:dihydroflavonol-4-reductase